MMLVRDRSLLIFDFFVVNSHDWCFMYVLLVVG